MNRILIIIVLQVCIIGPLKADEDFFTRKIVVPAPGLEEFDVNKDIVYLETSDGGNRADIFLPVSTDKKHPAVIFVHGGPIPKTLPKAKDWQFFQSYGSLATGVGFAGVVFNHRFNGLTDLQTASGDIKAAVDFIRLNARKYSIDKDRICLWFYSGGGSFVAPFLSDQPDWLKCLVIYYGVVDPDYWESTGESVTGAQLTGLDPFPLLESKPDWDPAFLIAEAGKDNAFLNAGLRRFSQVAMENGWKLEYWNHPTGPHGFDLDKDDKRSREIILRTLDFLKEQLDSNTEN